MPSDAMNKLVTLSMLGTSTETKKMTFNPHTATIDELRDWHAEWDGWKPINNFALMPHPYPPTLDGAASAMPPYWHIELHDNRTAEGRPLHPWIAKAWNEKNADVQTAYAPDRITAEYRLAALCRLADQENAK